MSSLPLNPTKSLPSFSDTTSSSSSKRDELMDVGTEFMTTNNASSKSSHSPASDTSAGQMPPDSTAAYQVFTMMVWGLLSNVHISNVIIFLWLRYQSCVFSLVISRSFLKRLFMGAVFKKWFLLFPCIAHKQLTSFSEICNHEQVQNPNSWKIFIYWWNTLWFASRIVIHNSQNIKRY